MNIFLTSQASEVLDRIATMLPVDPKDLKVVLIPTASDPYKEHPWIDADRAKLKDFGFQVADFDLKNKTEEETRKTLSKFDVIFVAGGNAFYLLNEAKKSGFLEVAKELVSAGKVYIGSSAGSYIACPTIEMAGWKNPNKNRFGLKDLSALNLVNFLVTAHYTDKFEEAVAEGKKSTKYKVLTLTDKQFIHFDGNNYKILT